VARRPAALTASPQQQQPASQPAPPRASNGALPRLLDRSGTAWYLGVSTQTVDSYRLQGYIKPVALPDTRQAGALRNPHYDVRDLDAFVDQMKVTTGGVR
jgi:hypothetical protein